MGAGVGAFCDATRDLAKGHILHAERPGFVNGGTARLDDLAAAVTGWAGRQGGRFAVNTASQTISYLSSHDDWTLWDKLVITMDPGQKFDAPTPEILRANRLAAAFCFGCQGHLFLLSGEEFARTKQGVKDSFNAPATLNRLDWVRAWAAPWQGLADYYRGLFALRKALPALCDKDEAAKTRLLRAWRPGRKAAAFLLDNTGPASRWPRLLLAYNAAARPRALALPAGRWQALADGETSWLWQAENPSIYTTRAEVPAGCALILGNL